MAGDWIKMRVALADDPAVIAMADALGEDEFSIVGRLHHLWSWADTQSRDGHAKGVTARWIDRYVRRDKFADAMITVGWLEVIEDGIRFPNFERHNGETAKSRALAANRKQKQRAVTQSSHDVSRTERDESVTREEKRREEKKEEKPARKRAVSLPAEFGISQRVRDWAKEKGHDRLEAHFDYFIGYARAKAPTYADWDQAFMNAVRDNWAKLPAQQPTSAGRFAGLK